MTSGIGVDSDMMYSCREGNSLGNAINRERFIRLSTMPISLD